MDGAYAPEQSESRLDVRQVIASLDFKKWVMESPQARLEQTPQLEEVVPLSVYLVALP